jgi:hypothetical protein
MFTTAEVRSVAVGGHLGLITEAASLAPLVDGFLAAP